LVQDRANAADIRLSAQQEGLTLLHEDAMQRVREGLTTHEEAVRVTARH
jgi:type II secretory ATPase GspE/PulE/Tfp pilus assembly ATPase PilB-like protein